MHQMVCFNVTITQVSQITKVIIKITFFDKRKNFKTKCFSSYLKKNIRYQLYSKNLFYKNKYQLVLLFKKNYQKTIFFNQIIFSQNSKFIFPLNYKTQMCLQLSIRIMLQINYFIIYYHYYTNLNIFQNTTVIESILGVFLLNKRQT